MAYQLWRGRFLCERSVEMSLDAADKGVCATILARACSMRSGGLILVLLAARLAFAQSETQQHIQHVESKLLAGIVLQNDAHQKHTLSERMKELHVPGVSVAVIHHGALEWARGYGITRLGGPPVTPDTLFEAGSISKPVAAMAALRLAQHGQLPLDADVNTLLKSWKLPEDASTRGKPVTVRELLSHTGGIGVHGFPGYAAWDRFPSLVQVLNGAPPANTPAIRSEAVPGRQWKYSGGGYTILQQILIDVGHQPFPKLAHDLVLGPIGMDHSTYQQPLPEDLKPSAATPYEGNGAPVLGGAHVYPEMAAAGLWTTPSDLARFAIEVQKSLEGKANHVLSAEMMEQMLTRGMGNWGLGVEIGGSAAKPYFAHGGVDAGFESWMVAYEQGGEGAVVMTNAQGGNTLAEEVLRSIAAEYGWPDYHPTVRTAVPVPPFVLATYTGTYELAPNLKMVITVKNGQLISQATKQPEVPLFGSTKTIFFPTAFNAEIEFFQDGAHHTTHLVLRQGGREMMGIRK
jgi:CubicO group peptidase (beta-lactamase class C family)